jgi:Protein of unknown function (DUF1499)
MIGRTTLIPEPYATAALRLSQFSLLLLAITLLLHRLSTMATPLAVNLIGASYALAGLGLALGLVAAISIWVRGRTGAWSAAWALLISGALWAWPTAIVPTYLALPNISDVSTAQTQPPAFSVLAKQRSPGANSVAYDAARLAPLQAQAYPDLRTLVIPRSAEEVYEVTLDLMRGRRGLGWRVAAEEAPQAPTRQTPGRPGVIEATDRTLILGFTDDIVIRVAGNDNEARVDIRSASRYGRHDFGANAARIRRFVRELSTRLDATGPTGVAGRSGVRIQQAGAPAAGGVKRPIERTQETAAPRR